MHTNVQRQNFMYFFLIFFKTLIQISNTNNWTYGLHNLWRKHDKKTEPTVLWIRQIGRTFSGMWLLNKKQFGEENFHVYIVLYFKNTDYCSLNYLIKKVLNCPLPFYTTGTVRIMPSRVVKELNFSDSIRDSYSN